MNISSILSRSNILLSVEAACQKNAIQQVSEHVENALNIDSRLVFDTLLARERLGSTAVGHHSAIPHGTFDGIENTTLLVVQLVEGINFDAPDGRLVRLLFVLLAPEHAMGNEHLKALATIARLLDDDMISDELIACGTAEHAFELLTEHEA